MDFLKLKQMSRTEWIKNLVLYGIGVGIMPLGVVLTINAHLGAGGYDALNFALAEHLGIPTSMGIYLTAFIVLIAAAIIRRSYPRIETFISSFFLGISTDFWKTILSSIQGKSLVSSVFIMMIGIVVVAFAVACYMISVFPTNPTDDFVVALNERGVGLGLAKVGMDVTCMILAFVLGGELGIGTLICTFGLGPVIEIFHRKVCKILRMNE